MLQGLFRTVGSLIFPAARNIAMASSAYVEPTIPTERATFGMACFWAPEPMFGAKKGVVRTKVGYAGGKKENPTYRSMGDHTEVIQIEFDPSQTDYKALLDIFWEEHDPTLKHKPQYKSAIYFENEEQKKLAEDTKTEKQKELNRPIVTTIEKLDKFYDAENYHQKYHLREHTQFYASLGLSDAALLHSNMATRLHGYLFGFGKAENFDEEAKKFGLSEEQIAYMKKQMANPRPIHCGT